jgi:hypothetical protein
MLNGPLCEFATGSVAPRPSVKSTRSYSTAYAGQQEHCMPAHLQTPQAMMQETTTRSPGRKFFTSGPTLATVPMNCTQADHASSGLMHGTQKRSLQQSPAV